MKIRQSEYKSVDRTDPAGEVSHGPDRPREWTGAAIDGLVRLAFRFLWNQADAEDAVHEAAIIAHSRQSELRDPNRWWPWVCSIVVQQCHLLGRRKAQRLRLSRRLHEPRKADDAHPIEEGDERSEKLAALLQQLPRRQREVIVLRHIEGMDFGEIAEALGISADTARVHAMRGRESLAARINERSSSNAM
ncbi:MAG: sigma-70 family RNA polymerase sigma factor [Planctomycetes bacterium]|nr:sigma-70 family RNA polymerase sigma factor [Planctomycetota bacterium]